MSRTIKAIMRHMVPASAGSGSVNASVQPTSAAQPQRKLRVVFAPPPLGTVITPNH